MSQLPSRNELLLNYEYVDKVSLVQEMTDAHIRVLRDFIEDWKSLMSELEVTAAEVKMIDLQERREVMKRHAALHKWRRKYGKKATYLVFMNACMRLKLVALVEKMLELLNETMRGRNVKLLR